MWYLKDEQGTIFHLFAEQTYIIGRRNADLLLDTDQSISRKHALIIVGGINTRMNDGDNKVSVVLTDENSKYGTYYHQDDVNNEWVKLTSNEHHLLSQGDMIRFGVQTNIWRLGHEPIVIATSHISHEEKEDLKKWLTKLDAEIVSVWNEKCTHLTMSKLTMTTKAACALACCVPIVTPQYWREYIASKQPPDCKQFVPLLAENSIQASNVTLTVNPRRKTIFDGKCFVFATPAKVEDYSMVTYAGGQAVVFETSGLSLKELMNPHIIVISYLSNESAENTQLTTFNNAIKYLNVNGHRAIPEQEIPLAILHCSLVKYCNPQFDHKQSVLGNVASTNEGSTNLGPLLALESQRTETKLLGSKNIIIPESPSSLQFSEEHLNLYRLSASQQSKRAPTQEIEDQPVFKKPCRFPEPSFSSNASSVAHNTTEKKETHTKNQEKDLFSFVSNKNESLVAENHSEENNLFDFPSLFNTSKRISEMTDTDLFGNEIKSSAKLHKTLEKNARLFPVDKPSTSTSQDREAISVPKDTQTTKLKRKVIQDLEPLTPIKKIKTFVPYNESIDQKQLLSVVSLDGFLDASKIKQSKEEKDADYLADDISDLVIIEEMPLMVRPRGKTANKSVDSIHPSDTKITKNFKLFRKVPQLHKLIVPRIIGGNDLCWHNENEFIDNTNEDHNSDSDVEDDWAFPDISLINRSKQPSQRKQR